MTNRLMVVLLIAFLHLPAQALQLEGKINNIYGRIGIRIHHGSHTVNHVYDVSPAKDAGLLQNDLILEADGIKGHETVDGMAGTVVRLKVKRGTEVLEFSIVRVPKTEVYDIKE